MSDHATHAGDGERHATVTAEPDRTNVRILGIFVALLAVFVFGSLVVLWGFFRREAEQTVYDQSLSVSSKELAELRAREQEMLGTTAVVDQTRKLYRVPVDRAIELYVRDARELQASGRPVRMGEPVPVGGGAGPEAAAPAPAPEGGAAATPPAAAPIPVGEVQK